MQEEAGGRDRIHDLDPNGAPSRGDLGATTRHTTLLAVACKLTIGLSSSQPFTNSNYSSLTKHEAQMRPQGRAVCPKLSHYLDD